MEPPTSQKYYFHEPYELFNRQLKRPNSTEYKKKTRFGTDTFPEAHDNEMDFMPRAREGGFGDRCPQGSLAPYLSTLCHQHPDLQAWATQGGREAAKCVYCKCWLNNPSVFLFAGGFREQM